MEHRADNQSIKDKSWTFERNVFKRSYTSGGQVNNEPSSRNPRLFDENSFMWAMRLAKLGTVIWNVSYKIIIIPCFRRSSHFVDFQKPSMVKLEYRTCSFWQLFTPWLLETGTVSLPPSFQSLTTFFIMILIKEEVASKRYNLGRLWWNHAS